MNQPAQGALERIPLHALHAAHGAKFGAFAGYEMPIQYPQGLKAEHLHTRERAGLFDVSHMGQLRIRAADDRPATLRGQLEAALPVDFEGWAHATQRYSLLLNERGGIEDDLMLVHLVDGARAEVRMVVNAGNRDADLRLLRERCPRLHVDWVDAALVALQGPAAEAALAALDPAAASLRFMQSATLRLLGADCFTTRSGYTGEDGYEISLPLAKAEAIVSRLLDNPAVQLAGLGARDTLRLEAGLCLYGHDLDPATSPIEADLAWTIQKRRREARDFPGAKRILREYELGPARKRVGIRPNDRAPAREGVEIMKDGKTIGIVTSGGFSPTLNGPISMGYVEAAHAEPGHVVDLMIRGVPRPATVTPLPFVPHRYVRKK
ncbi:MAG: glycine cleavage system aminomethyltransferase GcvT [Burkholderiaceae bacterium]|nr:glycine cleavage system aminomethyltransferase GcvT [Burkholderiaceae bacterium]